MKKIYIVGGNGFARECYLYIHWINQANPEIQFAGFLGHGGYGHTVDYKNLQEFYKGEVADHEFQPDEYVVIGAGYPVLRKKIYDELKARNLQFFNLIMPYVYLNPTVEIGEANVFVSPFSASINTKIGNCNVFNGDVVLGHDAVIGDCNFFGPKSQILGNVTIGNNNQIGAGSILLPKAKIGNNNIIAPLSAVYKGCKDNCYILGNPALKVGNTDN